MIRLFTSSLDTVFSRTRIDYSTNCL